MKLSSLQNNRNVSHIYLKICDTKMHNVVQTADIRSYAVRLIFKPISFELCLSGGGGGGGGGGV